MPSAWVAVPVARGIGGGDLEGRELEQRELMRPKRGRRCMITVNRYVEYAL